MTPKGKIDNAKIRLFHALFREIGAEATDAVRDQIEEMTQDRSTTSLSNGEAWDVLRGMMARLGRGMPMPIEVEWCPVHQRPRTAAGETNVARLASQKQVWRLFHLFREAGVRNPIGFLIGRFHFGDGEIRTSDEAAKVIAALENMKRRSAREGGRSKFGNHEHGAGRG